MVPPGGAVGIDVVTQGGATVGDAGCEDLFDCLSERIAALPANSASLGIDLGDEQRLIGVDVAHSGHRLLAQQLGLDRPVALASRLVQGFPVEVVSEWLRAHLSQCRNSVIDASVDNVEPTESTHISEHQLSAVVELPECPCVGIVIDATIARYVECVDDGEGARHAEVSDEFAVIVECEEEVLTASADRLHLGPNDLERRTELRAPVCVGVYDLTPRHERFELSANRLDLWEFRHGDTLASAFSMASLDQLQRRFLDEVEHSASSVGHFDSAAVAEAWASGAVAEWHALEGAPGALEQHLAKTAPLAARLTSWVEGAPMEIESADPDWVTDVGTHTVHSAARLLGVGSADEHALIFRCEAASGAAHDVSVTVVGDLLVSITIGPEGLVAAAVEEDGVEVEDMAIGDAERLVADALTRPLSSLSEASEANLPLIARRFGVGFDLSGLADAEVAELPLRDVEEDAYAADVVAAALRGSLESTPTAAAEAACSAFAKLVSSGDADALTVLDVAALADTWDASVESFERAVGAYLAPRTLAPHSPQEQQALVELEAADWIGVVLGLARSVPGTSVDGDRLVDFINKTPEITTTIPKKDRPRIAWAFEAMLYAWRVTGVLDDEGCVTDAAASLLPQAALRVWSSDR